MHAEQNSKVMNQEEKSRPDTPDQQPPKDAQNDTPRDKNLNEIKEGETTPEEEREIDEQLEQTFPASDPPSFSQPGNEDIKDPAPENE